MEKLLKSAIRDLQRGDFHKAEVQFGKLLKSAPRHAGLLNLMGLVQLKLERWAQAETYIGRALSIAPNDSASLYNYGTTLLKLRKFVKAVETFDRAILLEPNSALAWNNRGIALNQLFRFEEASAAFRRATAIDPGLFEAHANLTKALLNMYRPKEAAIASKRALELNQTSAELWMSEGIALRAASRASEALAAFRRAATLKPDLVDAYFQQGSLLASMGQHSAAIACFEQILAIDPNENVALGEHVFSLRAICNWKDLSSLENRLLDGLREQALSVDPGYLLSAPSATAADQLLGAKLHASNQPPSLPIEKAFDQDAKITVAYLSSDFREHAVATLIAGLIENHDREKFRIVGVSFGPDDSSPIRRRLVAAFDEFVDARETPDRALAEQLRMMGVHVAVDLMGYSQGARPQIFAWRAAPVQVNYLGYPGTSGLSAMDYIIADPIIIPAEHRCFYTEKVVTLPHSYQPNDNLRETGPLSDRSGQGLPDNAFVFCCFNGFYKITPAVFDVWMRLLKAIDDSVLWLFESNSEGAGNLRREAVARGVEPERLVFASRLPGAEHLSRIALADLALDTLPYNAHTTASDALWMGVPMVACIGETFPSRVSAGLLRAADCPQLVTKSLAEYENLALHLARNPGELSAIKAQLRRTRDSIPLFQTQRYARDLERCYTFMWSQYLEGKAPSEFSLARDLS